MSHGQRCHFDEGNRQNGYAKGPPLRWHPRENKKCPLSKGVFSEKVIDTNFIEEYLWVFYSEQKFDFVRWGKERFLCNKRK